MGIYSYLKKDGKVSWGIDYVDPSGKRVKKIIGSRKLAEKVLRQKLTEIEEGRYFPKSRRVLFQDFVGTFLKHCKGRIKDSTLETHGCRLKSLQAFFDDCLLSQINIKMAEEYISKRLSEVSNSTVNREMTLLKNMLNRAVEWEVIAENPIARMKALKEPPGKDRFLSWEEISLLLNNCKHRYQKVYILIGLTTGARKSEISSLRWKDIDFDNDIVRIKDSKTNKIRKVPLAECLKIELENIEERNSEELITPFKDIKRGLEILFKELDIKDASIHTLRHTFASHLAINGCSLFALKELMGHTKIEMTLRYAHLCPDVRKKAISDLSQLIGIHCVRNMEDGKNESTNCSNDAV